MKKKIAIPVNQDSKDFEISHYLFSLGWSEEDQSYIARVAEFPSLAAHGETMEEALHELKSVLAFVIEDLISQQEPVPEPLGKRAYSGRLNLRMPEQLHRRLAIEAAQHGISLNQVINLKLSASSF